jgi:tetratricopeptide (TPR) repeat protein
MRWQSPFPPASEPEKLTAGSVGGRPSSPWARLPAADTLALARRAIAAGFSPTAERLYRLTLNGDDRPEAPDDTAAIEAARIELAAGLFGAARPLEALGVLEGLSSTPNAAAGRVFLAEARRIAGAAREALAPARNGAEGLPHDAGAQTVLARVYLDLRQHRNAVTAFKRALEIAPGRADSFGGLARALIAINDLAAGERAIAEALVRAPDEPDALRAGSIVFARRGAAADAAAASHAAGRSLFAHGRQREALEALQTATTLAPKSAVYFADAGTAAYLQRRHKEAVEWLTRALALQPSFPRALSNLGATLMETGAFEDAELRLREALSYAPQDVESHVNLANLLEMLRRVEEGEGHYRSALRIAPDLPAAHLGLGICLLYQRRWRDAQPHYDHRPPGVLAKALGLPLWGGEAVPAESSLIVMTEQGFGDTLQFMGAVNAARAHFARVGFVCPPALRRIAQRCLPDVSILAALPADIGAADKYVNLLSLAAIVAPENEMTRPSEPWRPWIDAEPVKVEEWSHRLGARLHNAPDPPNALRRVGLCWGGGDALRDDYLRSVPLKDFAPILAHRDVHFVSLQVGAKRAEIASTPQASRLVDLTEAISDFSDTAAIIANLDLVISVDTAVAHLAGAMGKPVWMLNRFSSEWRWGFGRDNCAFYPSMRIFNQSKPREWGGAIDDIARELASFVRVTST